MKILSTVEELQGAEPGTYEVTGEAADELNRQFVKILEKRYSVVSNVPMPKLRRKPNGVPPYVAKAIDEYKAAYRARYGVASLDIEWRDGHAYIEANQGISVELLRKRTRQLRRLTQR